MPCRTGEEGFGVRSKNGESKAGRGNVQSVCRHRCAAIAMKRCLPRASPSGVSEPVDEDEETARRRRRNASTRQRLETECWRGGNDLYATQTRSRRAYDRADLTEAVKSELRMSSRIPVRVGPQVVRGRTLMTARRGYEASRKVAARNI